MILQPFTYTFSCILSHSVSACLVSEVAEALTFDMLTVGTPTLLAHSVYISNAISVVALNSV